MIFAVHTVWSVCTNLTIGVLLIALERLPLPNTSTLIRDKCIAKVGHIEVNDQSDTSAGDGLEMWYNTYRPIQPWSNP